MGSAQRRARAKDNLRRSILDAARELFATQDYNAVSMRRIAEKIEYSPTAIYLHFRDKQEILLLLIEEGFGMLAARLTALQIADPVERLRRGGQEYVQFAFTQPHYYRLMFQLEKKELAPDLAPRLDAAHQAFGFICGAVSQGQEAGLFIREIPSLVQSVTVWATLHGAVSLALSGHMDMMMPDVQRNDFFDALIEATIRGLRAAN